MVRIYLTTQGCSLNQSDSEVIIGILSEAGHVMVGEKEEADVVIINSCTVKSSPEQRTFQYIRDNPKKKIIVCGCVPEADRNNKHWENVSTFGPKTLSLVEEVVEKTLAGEIVHYHEEVDTKRPLMMQKRARRHIGIVPLCAGCLSNCSYCKTKQARGNLQSYTVRDIQQQCARLIADGVKEIWLTGQDAAVYGLDIGTNLSALLSVLVKNEGDYRIRVGMANPKYLLPQLDELIEVLRDEHLFTFLHIPIQAGSNKVLKDMRRTCTREDFIEICQRLRKAHPTITIATDIIVGFPTESEEDFLDTISLIEETRVPVVNISKFYPRPDTDAAAMKLIPTHIVKERSTRLKKICENIAMERNKSIIGETLSVIVDEEGKKNHSLIGRADNYVQVIVDASEGHIGERQDVTVEKSGMFDVRSGKVQKQ